MRYVMFVCVDPAAEPYVPEEDNVHEWVAEMDRQKVRILGQRLMGVEHATTVRLREGKVVITDGPFAETKELIAGFWLWQVRSRDEAIEWLKLAPFREGEVEIRQVFEAEDFGAEFTPELREQEERLRKQLATKR